MCRISQPRDHALDPFSTLDGVTLQSLGMPAMPPRTSAPTWKQAWDAALYGADGYFRRTATTDRIRGTATSTDQVALALAAICDRDGIDTVIELGPSGGELLAALLRIRPALRMAAVGLGPRPDALPADLHWATGLPRAFGGLVVANGWLSNVPCHVAQVDAAGVPRIVHVDKDGTETLGHAVDDPTMPGSLADWCRQWWPTSEPGARIEIGTTRDRAWADLVGRLTSGVVVAIDHGHTIADRPRLGSLQAYRSGTATAPIPDGGRDLAAAVAVDAVAQTAGDALSQEQALSRLGVELPTAPELAAPSRSMQWVVTATGGSPAQPLEQAH